MMNYIERTCPYCNSLIPPSSAEGKRCCPRCGEPLPARLLSGFQSQTSPGLRENDQPAGQAPPTRSHRSVAGIFLVLMAGMALLGLALALATLKTRKDRHPKVPDIVLGPRTHAPAELPALGCLPEDCNLVAGVHLADLLQSPAGKKLLEPPRPFPVEKGLRFVERWTGMKLEALDHLVLGTALTGDIPQLTVVARTRRPYRLEDVARSFAAKPLPHHKKPLFRIKLEPVGGGYLWCADDRTLVLVLRPDAVKIEDMDAIPALPRTGDNLLKCPLREVVESRLRQSACWVAGHLDPNGLKGRDLAGFMALSGVLPKNDSRLLETVAAFALGTQAAEDITLVGALKGRDLNAARKCEDFLKELARPEFGPLKVVGPSSGNAGLEQAAEGNWVAFQVRTTAERCRAWLEKWSK